MPANDDAGGWRFADFEFDTRRDELRRGGLAVAIRPKPRALLRYLLAHPGRLLEKGELIRILWGSVVVSDDSLVQCVGELRSALGDRGSLIRTLPRRGYMLDTAVEALDPRSREPPAANPAALPSAGPADPIDPIDPIKPAGQVAPLQARRASRPRRWLVAGLGVLLLCAAAAAWRGWQPAPFHIDDELMRRHAVAVMPLVDADAAEGRSPLATTLADDISTQIAARQGMRVIGPAAAGRYDAAAPDAARIGRELGVRYVLTGRVARDGDELVVDSKLTAVDTGEVVRINRSAFRSAAEALHSNLDQRVASAFRVQYYEVDNQRANLPGHVQDAADLTLLGWRDLNRFSTREDLLRARGRFEAALKVDPDSVFALQGLGSAYQIELVNLFIRSPQELLEPAMKPLRRALEISPDRPETLLPWGGLLELSGRPAEARAVFEKALELNPKYAFAHLFMAHSLLAEGRYAEAQREIEKARGMSPADARLRYSVYALSALASFAQGRDDEAYGWSLKWAAEYPKAGQPYTMLAAIDALHGRDAEAAADMARLRDLLPNETVANVEFLNPSTDAGFLAQRARLVDGLRKAGLPER